MAESQCENNMFSPVCIRKADVDDDDCFGYFVEMNEHCSTKWSGVEFNLYFSFMLLLLLLCWASIAGSICGLFISLFCVRLHFYRTCVFLYLFVIVNQFADTIESDAQEKYRWFRSISFGLNCFECSVRFESAYKQIANANWELKSLDDMVFWCGRFTYTHTFMPCNKNRGPEKRSEFQSGFSSGGQRMILALAHTYHQRWMYSKQTERHS